jgi:hypothetical protein
MREEKKKTKWTKQMWKLIIFLFYVVNFKLETLDGEKVCEKAMRTV